MCVHMYTHTHTHTHTHSGSTAIQQAEHARERDIAEAEAMLKQARNDLADAHARHKSELQERAQQVEALTQQVLQLEEEIILHQTSSYTSSPVVGENSWRQLEMPTSQPTPQAHEPRRSMFNIKSNSQAASSALAIVAGKQHERRLLHDEVVTREVKELGITRGSAQRDIVRWATQEHSWLHCRCGSSSSSDGQSDSDSRDDDLSPLPEYSDSYASSKSHTIQFSSRRKGIPQKPAVSTVRVLLR